MEIIISSNTSMPIYEQIICQIKDMIMSGVLKTGQPLPSMRGLAKSLRVSVITVQKAYEQLQKEGFIETNIGRGTFVSSLNEDFIKEEQLCKIENHLEEAVKLAKKSSIELDKLKEILTIFYKGE